MALNHYTSASGLEGILKKEHINLRATRYSHLNDSKEYRWIKEKIKDKKEDLCRELDIPYDVDLKTYPYVICFCNLPDDHLMWKLYGNDGKGYMLTFDYEGIKKIAFEHSPNESDPDHLQQIVYADENDWEEKFRENLKLFEKEGEEAIVHSSDIHKACALMKRRIYAHENETRYMRCAHDILILSSYNDEPETVYDGEGGEDFKFRVSDYGITPYIDINFPKVILKSITVGYGYNFQAQRDALNLLLNSRDYKDVEIIQSQIIP